MAARLIHTGQAIVDLVMNVDALPVRGGDVFASSHQLAPGGGFNVMAAAARDGAEVVYAGGHGRGSFGDLVRAALAAEGIAVAAPPDDAGDTGFCVAMIDADAERTFVSTVGAEGRLGAGHFEAVEVRRGDIVYVSGYTLLHPSAVSALSAWLAGAAELATVVLDTSPLIAEIPAEAFAAARAAAHVWTANEREARLLLERLDPGADPVDTPPDLAAALRDGLAATVLVRVGGSGCWLAERAGGPPRHVAGRPARAVDTNGAGDAHTGVLCANLARGMTLDDSVRRANMAAAIAVTRRGPATSPTRAEIDRAFAGLRSNGR